MNGVSQLSSDILTSLLISNIVPMVNGAPPPKAIIQEAGLGTHTHVYVSTSPRANFHKHTQINTNNPKQTQTEYETGMVGGVSYSRSLQLNARKSRPCTRHESLCNIGNTDLNKPD